MRARMARALAHAPREVPTLSTLAPYTAAKSPLLISACCACLPVFEQLAELFTCGGEPRIRRDRRAVRRHCAVEVLPLGLQ